MKIKLVLAAFLFFSQLSYAQFWKYSDPERLSGTINSEAEESIPVFSPDSSSLYFVRTFDQANKGDENDQDIWVSLLDEAGAYSDSKRVVELNNKLNNAVLGLSSDGTRMYLLNSYGGKKDLEKGIALATNNGGKWSAPEPLLIPELDIDGDFYGFHVSSTENVIILSFIGPGTLGEEDLFISIKENEIWSKPMHMGSVINSSGYEISPFLSSGNDTLFFSSTGFGGEGDADIFFSVKQGSWFDWSKPKNLGNRINSSKFDAYFSHSGTKAYWSSNRESERSDIYTIDIFTPPPLVASCSSTDVTAYGAGDGTASVEIESGADPYTFTWSNGYSKQRQSGLSGGEYSVTVTDAVGQKYTTYCTINEPTLPIAPVTVRDYENFEFKHLFGYNGNKVNVSKGKLKKFVNDIEEQLEAGRTNITVKIYSSASHVPTKSFGTNEKLAEVRAENVKYDLIQHFSKRNIENKINIVVATVEVAGPEYVNDARDKSKYEPYQFILLKTE